MPRFINLLVLGLVVCLCASVALAKPKDGTSGNKDKKDNVIVGTVMKVDGANILIKTRGKNAAEVNIVTNDKTEFQLNGKPATIEKIKPGQEVAVTPSTSSTAPVQKVSATSEEKKKGKKKK